jgi:hypothetical protein
MLPFSKEAVYGAFVVTTGPVQQLAQGAAASNISVTIVICLVVLIIIQLFVIAILLLKRRA